MERMIETFSSYPTWKKALILAGLPLVLLFLLVRSGSSIAALLNSFLRSKTDSASDRLDQAIQNTATEVANAQGKIEQLKEDKNEAMNAQDTTDPVAFYNNRLKRDDQ